MCRIAGSSCGSRAVAGVLAYVAIECGWVTTEVGRQPWIVYNIARTSSAVTTAAACPVSLSIVIYVLYALLGAATIMVLRAMARRWRLTPVIDDDDAPYGPRPEPRRRTGNRDRVDG